MEEKIYAVLNKFLNKEVTLDYVKGFVHQAQEYLEEEKLRLTLEENSLLRLKREIEAEDKLSVFNSIKNGWLKKH